jgi:hypothetical protein
VPAQAAYRLKRIYLGSWFKYRPDLKKRGSENRTRFNKPQGQDLQNSPFTCNPGPVHWAFPGQCRAVQCRAAAGEKKRASRGPFSSIKISVAFKHHE